MKRITGEDIAEALKEASDGFKVTKKSDAFLYTDLKKLGLVRIYKSNIIGTVFEVFLSELGVAVLKSYRKWECLSESARKIHP